MWINRALCWPVVAGWMSHLDPLGSIWLHLDCAAKWLKSFHTPANQKSASSPLPCPHTNVDPNGLSPTVPLAKPPRCPPSGLSTKRKAPLKERGSTAIVLTENYGPFSWAGESPQRRGQPPETYFLTLFLPGSLGYWVWLFLVWK